MKLFVRFNSLLVVLFLSVIFKGYSQDVYVKGVYPNLDKVKFHDVFLINQEATFNLMREDGSMVNVKSCKWYLNAFRGTSFYHVLELQENGNSCKFKLDKQITDKLSSAERIVVEGDSSVYNIVNILCVGVLESGETFDREFIISLNYLPTQPQFEVLDIKWDSYDKEWDIYDRINATVRFNIERCDKYLVTVFCEDMVTIYRYFIDFEDGDFVKNIQISSTKDYFLISAINKFGVYLHPKYFKLEKETKEADNSSVNINIQNTNNKLKIYPNPVKDIMHIDTAIENVKSLVISDISGKPFLRKRTLDSNYLNMQNIPVGTYILTIEYLDKKKIDNVKFIKK